MKRSIENYVPQLAAEKNWRRALLAWSVSTLIIFGWISLILLAPVAEAYNTENISVPLYNFFGYVCHQIPARSFHLENHAFAVCSRCFGIYFGLLAGFVLYPLFRFLDKTEPLSRRWLLAAVIPMAVDWTLAFFGIWENTLSSRFLTGLILGTACALFLVPAFVELAELFTKKNRLKKTAR